MEKTREVIVDTYRQILDKLMSASIEVDRAADPGMGSVEKKDIRTQIMRMQADFSLLFVRCDYFYDIMQ